MLPDAKLGIVVLTNGVGLSPKGGMAVGIPETLAAEFYDLVEYGELPFDRYKEMAAMFAAMVPHLSDLAGKRPPAKPAPASPSEQLIGTYDNDYFGPLTVEAINGKLQFTMGPKQMAFSLTHWNGDTFAFIPINEAKDAPSTIDFTLAQEGQPATLTIPYYNASGLGVFRKR
jgi:hypothetical protein